MRKKSAADIPVRPSMAWALRRPRTRGRKAGPPAPGGPPGGDLGVGEVEAGPLGGVSNFVDDRPVLVAGTQGRGYALGLQSGGEVFDFLIRWDPYDSRWRPHRQQEIRVVPLRPDPRPAPQQPPYQLSGQMIQHPHLPSLGCRRQPHGCNRMSHIVVTVAEGPLTVLPGLPPGDGTQTDQYSPTCRPAGAVGHRFQGMQVGPVMVDALSGHQPGLGGVEIAAGWIHPQGPAVHDPSVGPPDFLPGRQGQAPVE